MKKIITILSLVLCVTTTAFTQAGPQSTWASITSSGTSASASASEVEVIEVKEASSGNIYVLVRSNNGSNDIVQLIKYNAAGVQQFSQTYSSTAYERPIGMGLDNSENIYIVTDRGINNAKVLKYNSAGNLQWSYMYGGAITLIEPKAMIVNEATGDVYFTGSYNNMTNSEGENVMLAKLDNAGNSQWISYFNSSTNGVDIGYTLVKDNSDNIYVGAKEKGTLSIVLKFNASGTQQWKKNSMGSKQIHLVGTDKIGIYGLNDYVEYFRTNGTISNTIDFSASGSSLPSDNTAVYHRTSNGGFIRVASSGISFTPRTVEKFNSSGVLLADILSTTFPEVISYVDPYDDLFTFNKIGSSPKRMGVQKYTLETGTGALDWKYEYGDRDINTSNNSSNRIAFAEGANNTMIIARAFWHSATDMRIHVNKFCLPPKIISTSAIPSTGNRCHGDTIQVQANSTFADSYTWSSTNAGFTNVNAQNTDALVYNGTPGFNQSSTINIVADYNGCYSEEIVDGFLVLAPIPSDIDDLSPICEGGYGILSAINQSWTYNYEWLIDGVSQGSSSNSNDTIIVTQSGTYSLLVTQTNIGCVSDPGSVSILLNPAPTVTANASTLNICLGDAVTLTGSGSASSYSWDNSVINGVAFTPTVTATYTLTGSAGGCSAIDQITVNVNSATVNLGADVSVCQGMTATIDAGSGSSSYSWNTGASSQTITIGSGTYDVTITDGNGCQATDQIVISEYNAVIGTASTTDATCGNTNGSASVSVTSGTPPYSYSWSNGGNTQSISNLSAGSYTVTITDANGCEGQATASISSAGGASLTASSTDVLCNSNTTGTASVSTSGGASPFTYLWSTGGTASSVSNLIAGTYSVDVTDNNGCISSTSVTITEPSSFNVIPGFTDVSCNGSNDGVANVSVTGATLPYSYNWTSGGASASEANLIAGSYTVTITDVNNCTTSETITVSEPTAIVLTASAVDATCGNSDGSATTGATGGAGSYTYSWNDGASQTTQTATNLISGTYIVTVTDTDGCSNTASVNVNDAGAPALTTSITDVNCAGENDGSATVSATGGISPFGYLWDDGQTTQTANGLVEGDYTVTVTDNIGCSSSTTITVEATNQLPMVDLGPDSLMCSGASTTLDAGVGFSSYLWDDNSMNQTLIVSTSGTYSVEVTDNNGCSNMDAIVITTEVCNSIEEFTNNMINVFPNPSNKWLTIKGDDIKGKLLTLYSFEGKQVSQEMLLENTLKMDVSKYETGTYFIYIVGTQPLKIVIIK